MKKFFVFLVAFYPILSGYGFSPQADFGVFSIFAVGIICCLRYQPVLKFVFPEGYALFFVVALFLSLVAAQTIPLRMLLYSVNLCMACYLVDLKYLKKYYELLVLLSCGFLFLQVIVAYVSGVDIGGLVSFLPTIYESKGIDADSLTTNAGRHSSFFLEPSYFAQYVFPYVILKLFSSRRIEIVKVAIVSFAVFLSQSGNGAVLLIIIFAFWFIFENINFRIKLGIVIIGVLGLLLLFDYMGEEMERMLERTSEFLSYEGNEQFQSSGFIRFFRGYYAYADMPLFNKIFGANPAFVDIVVHSNYFFVLSKDDAYNGTQMLLLYHGLISCILFYRHLILMCWKKHSKELVLMVICCIWLMLGESYFLCARMFLTICLMYAMIVEGQKTAATAKVHKRNNKLCAEVTCPTV